MIDQLSLFDLLEEANGHSNGDDLRRGAPGAERLLVALVKNGLAEEHVHAAATIVLALDEGALRE